MEQEERHAAKQYEDSRSWIGHDAFFPLTLHIVTPTRSQSAHVEGACQHSLMPLEAE
jgi:hypothetical protein